MKKKIFRIIAIIVLLSGLYFGAGVGVASLWVSYYNTRICWENVQTHEEGCSEYWYTAEKAEYMAGELLKDETIKKIPIVLNLERR